MLDLFRIFISLLAIMVMSAFIGIVVLINISIFIECGLIAGIISSIISIFIFSILIYLDDKKLKKARKKFMGWKLPCLK